MLFFLRKFIILLCLCAGAMLTGIATAASTPDLRILIDASQSVHERDVAETRKTAVSTLLQHLPDEGVAGVWGYAQRTQRYARHGQTSALWKQVADIHVQHLTSLGRGQNPERALTNLLWDIDQPDRPQVHLLWLTDGVIDISEPSAQESRTTILQSLGNQMAAGRVVVHTLAVGPSVESDDLNLLAQLSEMTGGLHRVVSDKKAATAYAQALLRLMQTSTEALVDARGRFQISPGTERFTVFWPAMEGAMPTLRMPDGTELTRMTPMPAGRWLQTQTYELATFERPAVGWWTVAGPRPERIGVYGDLQLKVSGLRSPVVPSEETSARIELFHWGQQLTSVDFLDLLDVRAWLVQGAKRQPLPVERLDAGYGVFFINLDDGAYELEVSVVGPTFASEVVLPFTAKNPLRVEFRSNDAGKTVAWLAFGHTAVNYATVRASASVRRPPELSVIVPGQMMPSGLWQIDLPVAEGIVETSFAINGNYLNGEGFFMKTQALTLTLPQAQGSSEIYRFDTQGIQIKAVPLEAEEVAAIQPIQVLEQVETEVSSSQSGAIAQEAAIEPTVPLLPLWFVGVISLVLLVLLGVMWWLFKPSPLVLPESLAELGPAMEEPQAAAG